jgi:hypothetical protein
MKILIIEDQPWLLDMKYWPEGHEYVVAERWDEVPIDDILSFDGVMLDHRLPGLRGNHVAHRLKEAGYDVANIVRISSMTEGGYPEGIGPWTGKGTSNRLVAAILAYLQSDRGEEADQALSQVVYRLY